MARKSYKSPSKRRKERTEAIGYLVIAACVIAFAALVFAALAVDAAHGMTAGQSLDSWGL